MTLGDAMSVREVENRLGEFLGHRHARKQNKRGTTMIRRSCCWLGSYSLNSKNELSLFLKRRASVILQLAEGICSGPERMTLTDYGLTVFFIRAGAGIENKMATIECTLERHEHMACFWQELTRATWERWEGIALSDP